MNDLQILLLTVFAGLFILLLSYVVKFLRSAIPLSDQEEQHLDTNGQDVGQGRKGSKGHAKEATKKQPQGSQPKGDAATAGVTSSRKALKNQLRNQKSSSPAFSHPWLMTSLKGHAGPVCDMDYSSNGKFLASCSSDRSLLVWPTKLFSSKNHNPIRGNVTYDEADRIKWSPDSKAFLLHKAAADELEVYKVSRKEDGSGGYTIGAGSLSFPVKHSQCSELVSIDMASSGKFIMSCSSTTDLVLYDLRGAVLHKIDSCLMQTYCARISPDGRFVAASGFTPDVKLWEVKVKGGEVDKVKRAFELTGHRSGIWGFSFSADSARVATISKDGTWRLYSVNVEFERGQDPALLTTGSHDFDPDTDPRSVKIALSPDGKTIAASSGADVFIFDTVSCQQVASFADVHAEPVTGLTFDDEGKKLMSCGDKHIRVFHNVPGMRRNLLDMQSELQTAKAEGLKARLKDQIKSLQETLGVLENSASS